jgi:hypothetical protein
MTNSNQQNTSPSDRGVGYYNKEIIKNNKDNKDSKEKHTKIGGEPSSSGLASLSTSAKPLSEVSQSFSETESFVCSDEAPTPQDMIKSENVKRAVIQLFVNENSKQKHKLKVRLNLDTQGKEENVEFIATLTKDRRNYVKYLPQHSKDWFIEWADTMASDIKSNCDVKPYRGKFHFNQGYNKDAEQVNQIEDWCACVVWFHPQIKKWCAVVSLFEFEQLVELETEFLTDAQKKVNVHAQKLWLNPLHNGLTRPKTWAQKRMGK